MFRPEQKDMSMTHKFRKRYFKHFSIYPCTFPCTHIKKNPCTNPSTCTRIYLEATRQTLKPMNNITEGYRLEENFDIVII